jgi:hypothetical protein
MTEPADRWRENRPDIAKNVLQDPARTQEQAAWELLCAIRDLYPERTALLRAIGEQLAEQYDEELAEDDLENLAAEGRFLQSVRDWTDANGITCESVNEAAKLWATKQSPEVGLYGDVDFEDPQGRGRTPSLTAYPFNETREEFVERAGRYYDEIRRTFDAAGVTSGPIKRNRDHFRYLAAHLVGRVSFAEISRSHETLGIAAVAEKTVAGSAREVAQMLGLPLRNIPGPKPGFPRKTGHRASR